jgi:hypothetical protein
MDLNYSYSLLSFTVGTLSGFQSVAEKYGKSRFRAIRTWPGVAYLTVRGLASALVFLILYGYSLYYWSPGVYQRPFVWAIICGTGAEYLLRSKVFLLEKKGRTGRSESLMLGFPDLLKWFQDFFLNMVEEKLEPLDMKLNILKSKGKIEFLKENMPEGTFVELRHTVETNLLGFEKDLPEQVREIRKGSEKLEGEYRPEGKPTTYDEEFKHKLGHVILDQLGKDGFRALAPRSED